MKQRHHRAPGSLPLRWLVVGGLYLLLAIALTDLARSARPPDSPGAADGTPSPAPAIRGSAEPKLNPFPATAAMAETIRAVLADYNRAGLQGANLPVYVPSDISHAYLPLVLKDEPPTPTPSPTVSPPPSPPPTRTRVLEPEERADIAVTLWPSPSIRVARAGTLAYEIRVKNYGAGDAARVRVTLPYNRRQMYLFDSRFTSPEDWVSEVANDRVTVTFGRLKAGGYRPATLFFRVAGDLADQTVISMRATYTWWDAGGDASWRTNWAPVLVGSGNASASWLWLAVEPVSGRAGTTHHFFSDRFIPQEGIVTWLNTPSGVEPLDLRGVADSYGRIWLDFRSAGLAPGTYSLVLYGARSNLTAVATFYVSGW
jgi:hypothetical protein